jgi:hypothetical protein
MDEVKRTNQVSVGFHESSTYFSELFSSLLPDLFGKRYVSRLIAKFAEFSSDLEDEAVCTPVIPVSY